VSFNPGDPAGFLTDILEWLEARIDLAHMASVEERFRKTYHWEPVDRPPIILSTRVPAPFVGYPYGEAFENPTKMMVNELIGPATMWDAGSPSIVNSVVVKDDLPLQIRGNYGIGILGSLFGAQSAVIENSMPWVMPLGRARVGELIEAGVPALKGGLYARAIETMQYYREMLAPYPKCRQAIRITQPDQQGPFDILAQLWGGEGIFLAFYDEPAFLRRALDVIGETYVRACRAFAENSTQQGPGDLIYLHISMQRGACVLKDDSSVMLSPKVYREFIQPANGKVLTALGGGSIHWCGCGDHWRREYLDTPGLLGMDLGDPHMVDLAAWKPLLQAKKVCITNAPMSLEQFETLQPLSLLPTGSPFTVTTETLDEGRRLLERLRAPAA